MFEFFSLKPSGLPEEFDMEQSTEKPVISLEEKEDSIEINYIFPGFSVGDCEQQVGDKLLSFKEVGISGAGFVSESGKPLLPSFGRFVQIPPGCDYEIITEKCKPVIFDELLITPSQELVTDGPNDTSGFEYDEGAYKEDALYPENVVEIGEPQNVDDYKALAIQVRPLQFNAAKNQLYGYANIKITIKLTENETDQEELDEFPLMDPVANREGFGNLVLNPRRNITSRIPVRRVPNLEVLIKPGTEFLIIYDGALKAAAERLRDWKERKGLTTEIVSISTVGNSVSKIKAYIRNKRKLRFSRLRYVLLFGDVNSITAEEAQGVTTDLYYFTKKDATSSSDCILPWVSGGRIPVSSLTDAYSVVDQIIRYEKTPPCDPEYYKRMAFAAYFQDDSPQDGRANRAYMKTMEGIRNHMTSIGFDVERIYVSNNLNPQKFKDGSSVPWAVRNAIVNGDDATDMLISEAAEGQLIIGHRDHGSSAGWAHPAFQRQHLESITSRYPSIFYSVNCSTGTFDRSMDSFAEDILEMDGGAPSLIAATENSGTWRNDSLMKGLFDAMWPGVISGFPGSNASYAIKHNRLGDILNYAKSYLLVAHGTSAGVKDHFEMYHVIGDPTLQLWAEEPDRITLSAYVKDAKLHIHTNPVPANSVMTIWHQGKLIKRAAVSSRRITIPVSELRLNVRPSNFIKRQIYVCFSAPGCRYIERRVRY